MMKCSLAILAFPGFVAAQSVVDTGARPIDLPTAVSLAQKNSAAAIQARGTIRSAQAVISQSRAAFFPSLSFSASNSHSRASGFGSHGSSFGFGSALELYDGGRRSAALDRAKSDLAAGEAAEVAERYQIAFQVKQQYYNALSAREAEAAAQAQVQEAQKQVEVVDSRLRAGVATRSDSLRAIVALGNARLAVLTARNNLQIANATLTRLVGSEEVVTANPADTLDQQIVPPDSATIARLIDQAPAIRQAELELSSAKVGIRSAVAPYRPTVGLSFSRNSGGEDQLFGLGSEPYQQSQSWSLSLGFPLYDNLNRRTNLERARIAEDNATASLRESRLLVRQTVTQSLAQMRNAAEQITLQLASVAAALEDVRVQETRYGLNATTILDVITSQTQLDQARAALIRARYDYRIAKAQLEAAIGRDL